VNRLQFNGLETRPSQVWGGVRLVPLVREKPIASLRLHHRATDPDEPECCADLYYMPHGLVAEWTDEGTAVPAVGTALQMPAATVRRSRKPPTKLERRTRVRFVPHQTSLEAYLPLSFRGPSTAWAEWSRLALAHVLPRTSAPRFTGEEIAGLQDALRVFEIHPGQCGVLVYVADALSGVFITPHPDDYRALHPTLVHDCYGELIWRYAFTFPETRDFTVHFDASAVDDLAGLRAQADRVRDEWRRFHDGTMAAGLLEADYAFTEAYRMAGYTLWRFRPRFERGREAHVGEAIADADGRLAYLHSFRLSETQIRNGQLLQHLSEQDWNLEDTAAAMGLVVPQLVARLDAAGYAALFRQDVVDRFRAMNVRYGR
jgi:hypothetical protein